MNKQAFISCSKPHDDSGETSLFCILVWMIRQGNHVWHNAYMQRDETVAHRLAVSTSCIHVPTIIMLIIKQS